MSVKRLRAGEIPTKVDSASHSHMRRNSSDTGQATFRRDDLASQQAALARPALVSEIGLPRVAPTFCRRRSCPVHCPSSMKSWHQDYESPECYLTPTSDLPAVCTIFQSRHASASGSRMGCILLAGPSAGWMLSACRFSTNRCTTEITRSTTGDHRERRGSLSFNCECNRKRSICQAGRKRDGNWATRSARKTLFRPIALCTSVREQTLKSMRPVSAP